MLIPLSDLCITNKCIALQAGVSIIVGTPGRVYDMINRRVIDVNSIKMFVLDESDEMLSRGFKDQICDIFRHLESSVQV